MTFAAARPAPPDAPPRPPLRRPRECAVSGVSAGLAAHLGVSVWLVRTLFVLLVPLWGAGLLMYAWLWAFMPWAPAEGGDEIADASPSRRAPVAWILTGASVVALVASFSITAVYGSPLVIITEVPAAWIAAVAATTAFAAGAGLWATMIDRADPARGPRQELAVRITATVVLVVLIITVVSTMRQTGPMGFGVALIPIAGLALVYASTLMRTWRELSQERMRRIREEQRSEMAAHLHDSVLQTLALIQSRAGASSEVARLARAQERELRAWLYDGDAPADSDLPTDLRDYAAALELDYPVHIDVVSAGLSAERASGEVAAAAREAMLNAARHAGGEVSVYIEGRATGVDVYVRDRGPGFAIDAVPGDRLGVRESILGRMRRAGGTASVRGGVGGVGTEVHLHLEGAPGEPRRG
ncbi:PspC domain-containing protein [Microbacterium sp. BWT-B31]|uniref:ATP-binding protein n=1 Tax=Microbacterium sp. BWT-B31 TaxID=3232072 RepID=UPI0035276339